MNRRDELRERYEDALFAFLMEDVIETEGKKMLEENERLKQDPLAAVPEAVDYRCIQTIKRGFAKERRHILAGKRSSPGYYPPADGLFASFGNQWRAFRRISRGGCVHADPAERC